MTVAPPAASPTALPAASPADSPAAPALPPGMAWPRPPEAVPAGWLERVSGGARITVAGLVLVRQRPGTAKGVIFITLEDETGIVNVIVWRKIYERFRRAVIAGRLLRVTGRLQRESGVTHLISERIEDISPLLDALLHPGFAAETARAGDQPQNTRPDARGRKRRPGASA